MRFQTTLVSGKLIRRYKRFLADVVLDDGGAQVVVHCPNPGAMTGLAEPGMKVWLEPNDDPRKKLNFGWRLVQLETGEFACVDTGIANKVVGEALRSGGISGLPDVTNVRAEVPFGENSRVDFTCDVGGAKTFIEVKSVTLMRQAGLAEFPDTVTKRGAKHLYELAKVASTGGQATMLYVVQRTDCDRVAVAGDIDKTYADAVRAAGQAGVQFVAVGAEISPRGIVLGAQVAMAP